MGIDYWKKRVYQHGSRTLMNLMSYSSNGNWSEDKNLSKFFKRLAFDTTNNYMEWDEYRTLVAYDPTNILHEPSLSLVGSYEYYAIIDDVCHCKILTNGTSRPLKEYEIFILDILDIQYEYHEHDLLFVNSDSMLLVEYLNTLELGTRHILDKSLIIDKNMRCNGKILYYDRLY